MKKLNIGYVSKGLLIINIAMAFVYLSWWFNLSHADNWGLYFLLLFGELYHVFMAISFWHTIWPSQTKIIKPKLSLSTPDLSVSIFITVVSEPVDVVERTVRAAQNINYINKKVYILNDGKVAKNPDWTDYEILAKEVGCECITRSKPGGAKAGNINNALRLTESDLILIFDADMVATPNFLNETIGYFEDPKTGFVQTPQYYINHQENLITQGSWQQQAFFFGSIMKGKESSNSSFICGTNVLIRKSALLEVGGMAEDNIAEDFLTSLIMHQNGWKSYYVEKVLAKGLAPRDPMSYFTQQLRWARGSLEMIFTNNPFLKKGLSLQQRISYASSSLFYLNGLIVLIDIVMPLLYFFFDQKPVSAATTSFTFYFLPFITLSLYTLYVASRGSMTFLAMSFSQASFTIQLMALWSVMTGKKISFQVTSKQALSGNFLFLIYPHIIYILLVLIGGTFALFRDGLTPAWVANIAWAITNSILFIPYMVAVTQNLWDVSKVDQKQVVGA